MNVLIVEDEPLASERLQRLLSNLDPSIRVLESLDTVEEAATYMEKYQSKIDLAFLDIQLADGKSFEIFSEVSYVKPVIFTTAHDEYTLKAFELNSIDYLLKPVTSDALQQAIIKYKSVKKVFEEGQKLDSQVLMELLANNTQKHKKRFLVKIGNRIVFKNANEAGYFFAEDKICYLVSKQDGKKYMVDHTLEDLDTELLDPEYFFRISRQHIVNIEVIDEVKNFENNRYEVVLKAPYAQSMVISRGRTNEFKKWLNH